VFIRRKIVKGVTYHALVESYRKDGKVRQRTLYSLGRGSSFDVLIEEDTERLAHYKKPETCAMAAMAGIKSLHLSTIIETEKRIEVLRDWKARLEARQFNRSGSAPQFRNLVPLQLNESHQRSGLTVVAASLSSLQFSILKALENQTAEDDDHRAGHVSVPQLVRAHYGVISREKQRKKYQAAFAAMSRALVRLENAGMIARYVPQLHSPDWFSLLPAGREALLRRRLGARLHDLQAAG
jgi:hypothetical protein